MSNNSERMGFLEIEADEEPLIPLTPPKAIPPDQFLSYPDLQALLPTEEILSRLPVRLLRKYRVLPLAFTPPQTAIHLPRHFQADYQTFVTGKREELLHLAMVDPQDYQALQIVRNWTGLSLHAIALKSDAFDRFCTEKADLLAMIEAKEKPTAFAIPKPLKSEKSASNWLKWAVITSFAILATLVSLILLVMGFFPALIRN